MKIMKTHDTVLSTLCSVLENLVGTVLDLLTFPALNIGIILRAGETNFSLNAAVLKLFRLMRQFVSVSAVNTQLPEIYLVHHSITTLLTLVNSLLKKRCFSRYSTVMSIVN